MYAFAGLPQRKHHLASGGHQRCCLYDTASQKVRPYLNPDAR